MLVCPLAVEYATEGFSVVGIDVHSLKVDSINLGTSYLQDVLADDVDCLVRSERIFPTLLVAPRLPVQRLGALFLFAGS